MMVGNLLATAPPPGDEEVTARWIKFMKEMDRFLEKR